MGDVGEPYPLPEAPTTEGAVWGSYCGYLVDLQDAAIRRGEQIKGLLLDLTEARAGQAATPDGRDTADFWFKVAVNTAARAGLPCPRCTHPTQAHWPDNEGFHPGCHRGECLCSWTPQELLIAADAATREVRHVAEFMSGYMSPRCLNGMDGCDDRACICRCHEENADATPAAAGQDGDGRG